MFSVYVPGCLSFTLESGTRNDVILYFVSVLVRSQKSKVDAYVVVAVSQHQPIKLRFVIVAHEHQLHNTYTGGRWKIPMVRLNEGRKKQG